jgi:hypothetical protein
VFVAYLDVFLLVIRPLSHASKAHFSLHFSMRRRHISHYIFLNSFLSIDLLLLSIVIVRSGGVICLLAILLSGGKLL